MSKTKTSSSGLIWKILIALFVFIFIRFILMKGDGLEGMKRMGREGIRRMGVHEGMHRRDVREGIRRMGASIHLPHPPHVPHPPHPPQPHLPHMPHMPHVMRKTL